MSNIYRYVKRLVGGKVVTYEVHNESYDDDYGSLVINYVPYRIADGKRERLSPASYLMSQMEAEGYLRFGTYEKCEHCDSIYFKREPPYVEGKKKPSRNLKKPNSSVPRPMK